MATSETGLRVEAGSSGSLALVGELTFATAAQALNEGVQAMRQRPLSRLDLSGLRTVDSAGLACVLALVAEARKLGHALEVEHLPEGMRALARVSDVEPLLDPMPAA